MRMKTCSPIALLSASLLVISPTLAASYKLQTSYQGNSLVTGFNWETGKSDNGGMANYNSYSSAHKKGLVATNKKGAVTLKVSTTPHANLRDSIRLSSKKSWSKGLFIFDVNHIPSGCGVWPAIWMVGPNWPASGEIDVIEGVHEMTQNAMSTHTNNGCVQGTSGFNGLFMMAGKSKNNCDVPATNCQGCGVRSKNKQSYGPAFNVNGGGVYALLINSAGVTTYHWAKNKVPADVKKGRPVPSKKWGVPENFVHSSGCNPSRHFKSMQIVINTNLCGTWPDGVWSQDLSYAGQKGSCRAKTGHSTCQSYIKSSGHSLTQAYWGINSIKVYE